MTQLLAQSKQLFRLNNSPVPSLQTFVIAINFTENILTRSHSDFLLLLTLKKSWIASPVRSAQNATWPLKKMVAAIIWFVGTRTAKLSSAGSAWVHGNRMARPGKILKPNKEHYLCHVRIHFYLIWKMWKYSYENFILVTIGNCKK